ncbi:tetratricopeptide repeat protein [Mycobacterium seoulense]|uniref:tetratricopeptide repeat protein n=1 Tax=Mycobacterium seoulense TaxID=386911 RepID=UPI003CEDBCB2
MVIVTTVKNPKAKARAEARPDAETPHGAADDAGDPRADEPVAVATVEADVAAGGDVAVDGDEGEGALLKRKRPEAEHRKRPWRRYLRRSALPALLVAALAISGFLGWRQWQDHQVRLAGEQAQQAAIGYAQVLTSIDSNKVDENFRQVLDGATGEFKDMYTQSSVKLRQLLIDNKATAHGVVVDSAIQSQSTNKVVVLVFIDQTVTNTAAPDPRIDRSRIKMTMEKVDGRWRASKVQLL